MIEKIDAGTAIRLLDAVLQLLMKKQKLLLSMVKFILLKILSQSMVLQVMFTLAQSKLLAQI